MRSFRLHLSLKTRGLVLGLLLSHFSLTWALAREHFHEGTAVAAAAMIAGKPNDVADVAVRG